TFLNLLARMGGPIKAKELAFWGGFAGVLGTGVTAGLAWELLRRRRRGGRIALVAVFVFTSGVLAGLWPVLGASYIGLPPEWGAPASALTLVAAILLAALLLRWLQPPRAGAGGPDGGRRSLLVSGAGVALLAATGGFAGWLNAISTFPYDGTRLLVRGARRLPITPVPDFYVVTKNLIDPD